MAITLFTATMAQNAKAFSVNPLQVSAIYEHVHLACRADCPKASVIYYSPANDDEANECIESLDVLTQRWNASMGGA